MEKFNPTKEMIEAARSVLLAMAYVKTIKPIVDQYQSEILAKHQFHIAKRWIDKDVPDQIILDPDKSYLLEDADFLIYDQKNHEAAQEAGLKVDNPEFCPLLVAEDLQRRAENSLIETMNAITHLEDYVLYGDNRKKFLDLTLRLLVPFVGNVKEILQATI